MLLQPEGLLRWSQPLLDQARGRGRPVMDKASCTTKMRGRSSGLSAPSSSTQEKNEDRRPLLRKRKREDDRSKKPCEVILYFTPLGISAASSPNSTEKQEDPFPWCLKHWALVFVWDDLGYKIEGLREGEKLVLKTEELSPEEALNEPGKKLVLGKYDLSEYDVKEATNNVPKRSKYSVWTNSCQHVVGKVLNALGIENKVKNFFSQTMESLLTAMPVLLSSDKPAWQRVLEFVKSATTHFFGSQGASSLGVSGLPPLPEGVSYYPSEFNQGTAKY